MQIDGYMLREALKQWGLRKDAAEKSFSGSLHKFRTETKDSPQQIVETLIQAETAIAKLQVAQMRYNLAVEIRVGDETLCLGEAIKRVGAAGRIERLWKGVSTERRSTYYDSQTRDPNQEYAEATIDPKTVLLLTTQAGKRSGALRAAIATANATKVAVEDLSPALFE